MKINSDNKKIEDVLNRGVERIIKRDDLIKKLKSGKQLRIKHGIDPTTKDLQLGYSAVYLKLKNFQDMGHKVIFLIGDYTGRFGDPTQKLEMRKLRSKKEVKSLAKNYLKQVGKILDLRKTEVRYNSEWYDKFTGEDMLKLMSNFTIIRMLERDMFQERIKEELEIGLHEPVYSVLQAYDSVMLKSDLTVCGIDQIFNEIKGRELQKKMGQNPQDIIGIKMLVGLDGKEKMSQSLGNYIGIGESAKEQYGKIMSIPDELILDYFELVTRVSLSEIKKLKKELDPRDLKARLAKEIVLIYHNKKSALIAEKEFNKIFRDKKTPTDIQEKKISEKKLPILDLLVKTNIVSSKAGAKRLIMQGGVKIDSDVQNNWKKIVEIKKGMIIQAGKRRFVKVGL